MDTNSVTWIIGPITSNRSDEFNVSLTSDQMQSDTITWTVTNDYEIDSMNNTADIVLTWDEAIYGCTDMAANNYNPMATHDDATCTYDSETDLYITANPAYANQMENNA